MSFGRVAALFLLGLACACGGARGGAPSPRSDGGVRDAGASPDGGPIDAPAGSWTWVPVEGSRCGAGAQAGLGLNRADGGEELLLFLQGGGACWNAGTCVPSPYQFGPLCDYGQLCLLDASGGQQPTATFVREPDPYPADGGGAWPSQLATVEDSLLFDRTLPDNPFRAATFVFVPYCTGDLHAGDAEQVYPWKQGTFSETSRFTMHFWGARNMEAYLQRLQVTFPSVRRVWLMGASAGGYGAQLNLERVRRAFPSAEVHVLADSAPLIRSVHFEQWKQAWSLQLPSGCEGCDAGLPGVAGHLLESYPDSRQALLSYDEDKVIAWYFLAGPGLEEFLNPPVVSFQQELSALQATYDISTSGGTFRLPGNEHVMFGGYGVRRPDGGTTAPFPSRDGGMDLRAWVHAWATGDGGWR
ncbi:MAG: hypothetical protein RL653_1054 [Pseudomonadota bacterium]